MPQAKIINLNSGDYPFSLTIGAVDAVLIESKSPDSSLADLLASGKLKLLSITPVSKPSPVTIALDYFGIKDTHWISQVGGSSLASIQLAVLIRDEQKVLKAISIPPEPIPAYNVDFFQVIALKDNMSPEIFTGSPTGSLTVLVAAYNVNKGPITKAQMDILGQWLGMPEVGFLKSAVPDKELVGYYWHTWSPSENWGIGGNYQGDLNKDNLIVWLRIGSEQMPTPIQKPVLKPNVGIQSLSLPSDAKTSSGPYVYTVYSTTLKLANNESIDVTVNWQANSSVTGNFDSGTVTVPKNGYIDIPKSYAYTKAGPVTITYTIYYRGTQLDTKSGTMDVAP